MTNKILELVYDKHDYLIISFFIWFRLGFWISCTYWTLKGFWISCIYWTGTRDFCTRQIFKGFLDFLTGTPDFLYKLNF
ncbi:unnamed protein product [Rhizophagus irregularis]|nr:unnamed protein product [Rhizophagus irregularis]